jgi:hypothetical protein
MGLVMTYVVQGDPRQALDVMGTVLAERRFKVYATDSWSGTAELGSKVKGAVLGAASLFVQLDYAVTTGPDGLTRLSVRQGSSGWMGGAIGASRTKKLLASLQQELGVRLAAAGLLLPAATERDPDPRVT